jgi:hypothetical protein
MHDLNTKSKFRREEGRESVNYYRYKYTAGTRTNGQLEKGKRKEA